MSGSFLFVSYPLEDYFVEYKACLAGRCLFNQNINKYSNTNPFKGMKE